MLDAPVLLALPAADTREEGELLVVVGGDEIRAPPPVVRFEVGRRFSRPRFDQDDEFGVGELENEFVLLAEIRSWLQTALLEGGGDGIERVPARDIVRGDLLESHGRTFYPS